MKKGKTELIKEVNAKLKEDLANAPKIKVRQFGGFSGGYGVHGETKFSRRTKPAQREKHSLKQYCY